VIGPAVEITLDSSTLEQLAELLAARLDARQLVRSRWVGADEVAAYLGVERGWVYENADRLRAIRLGEGRKPRLRFRLDLVNEALEVVTTCPEGREPSDTGAGRVTPKRRRRRSAGSGTRALLLLIRGRGDRDAVALSGARRWR
jgi:hypothetical protein